MDQLESKTEDELMRLLDENLSSLASSLATRASLMLERTDTTLLFCVILESQCTPQISISAYCNRLAKYLSGCPSAFVLAAIYLDEYGQKYIVTDTNVHRLLLTVVVLAYNYLEDLVEDNNFMSKLGGVRTNELFKLQMWMASCLNYSLNVSRVKFLRYVTDMTIQTPK
jgi:hypothetical protein